MSARSIVLGMGLAGAAAYGGDGALTPGNVLVNDFNWPAPAIAEYSLGGELLHSAFAIQLPLGCATMPDGRIATTVRGPVSGLNVFDADGTEVFTFATPEVSTPGDINVFSDGVLAVCDQDTNWIETYSVDVKNQTATYLGPIAAPPGNSFFGGFVDHDNNLWAVNVFDKRLLKFARQGSILKLITSDLEPAEVVVDPDGTLWVAADLDDQVIHISSNGDELETFPAGVNGFFLGIALAQDGTLYVTGQDSTTVRHLSRTGDLLDSFALFDPQVPVFLNVVPPPPPLLGDWDEDGDVDIADYKQFRQCARGPGVQASGACRTAFDFDNDLDVDLHDWWVFHQAFTGEILSATGRIDRPAIKRKRVELIPPAYPEVILDVEADPNSPEVVVPRR